VTTTAIPLGDAPAFRVPRRRTVLVRSALAAALVGAGVAALLVSGRHALSATPLLSPGSKGVVVLDLSASVEVGTLQRMYASLTQFASSKGRFGLVVFSDDAYEALPPGTPAAELEPYARFFHRLPHPGNGATTGNVNPGPTLYPPNPWQDTFSFGTTISSGLDLARSIVLADRHSRRSVWLISDLADAAPDRPVVSNVAKAYIRSGIALHVVGLDPARADERFFQSLLGPGGSLVDAKPVPQVRSRQPFPVALGVVAALLGLLLAANELLSTPLRWGARLA
jgi:hypothetical protein